MGGVARDRGQTLEGNGPKDERVARAITRPEDLRRSDQKGELSPLHFGISQKFPRTHLSAFKPRYRVRMSH